jgi:predicted nucleic acid-binding protein
MAATAIVHGLDIISRNEKNKGLKGVKVINLHKL